MLSNMDEILFRQRLAGRGMCKVDLGVGLMLGALLGVVSRFGLWRVSFLLHVRRVSWSVFHALWIDVSMVLWM